jgi:glutamate 5-kinase
MELEGAQRVVIKIGSSLLMDKKEKGIRHKWLKSLVEDVVTLRKKGKEVVIVTSGSVALGKKYIKFKRPVLTLEEKQAAAACGQTDLARNYQRYFFDKKIQTAQILLTIFDSENRRNYLNAKSTIETLIENDVLPIVNENDTVATHGLRFGDNDRLAARVAQMVGADCLILFSDIDGLYTANPNIDEDAVHIEEVEEIDERIEAMASGSSSAVGTGGMVTKIAAAKITMMCGCNMILAKGFDMNPVQKLLDGGKHTLFISKENPLNARKQWIANSLHPSGQIIIDTGAIRALQDGNSLLPAGVIDVVGEFDRGDAVEIKNSKMERVGIGIVAYSSADAHMIKGHQSQEIEHIIGFSGRNDLIHANDLVVDGKV